MAKVITTLLIILTNIHNIIANNLGQCVQETPCVCKFNEYSLVDISKIIGDQQPPYLIDAEGNSTFYFSGCKNASLDATTKFSVNYYIFSLFL